MKSIDGITCKKELEFALFHISDLTSEIKALLKGQLSYICYGRSCSLSGHELFNYTNTLKEFIARYENKSNDIQVGMIGELIAHVIINEFFGEYDVASPFFNKEERSIKKGFDVILSKKEDRSLWITEVKSGGLHKDKDSNKTAIDLLGSAKRDLIKRLNEENRSLWLNAINDAKNAFENHVDLKDSIVEILAGYGLRAGTEAASSSNDHNVFLVSALFAPLGDTIRAKTIKDRARIISEENAFDRLFIMSIQKGTHKKVYEFLKQESKMRG